MASNIFITIILFYIFLFSAGLNPLKAKSLVKIGYWLLSDNDIFPISHINSSLFTHLIYASVSINSSSYELSIPSQYKNLLTSFTDTVKVRNPSITTLLSISADYPAFSELLKSPSSRKIFIDDTIRFARSYGFQGLDLNAVINYRENFTSSDMENMGTLLVEWRAAVNYEAGVAKLPLILTAVLPYAPDFDDQEQNSPSLPVDFIRSCLDWVHLVNAGYHVPERSNFTGAHAALYDPSSVWSTDYGIKKWIDKGLDASKIVMGLHFYGYAWRLMNPAENGIGSPASGPSNTSYADIHGRIIYNEITSNYITTYKPEVLYNSTYVVKYFTVDGSTWICFDDAEIVKTKVSYAMDKKLLGYFVWTLSFDDYDEVLSLTAAQEDSSKERRKTMQLKLFFMILIAIVTVFIIAAGLLCLYYSRKRIPNLKAEGSKPAATEKHADEAAGDQFTSSHRYLQFFSFAEIDAATEGFSEENFLGKGGYGDVYMGVLSNGEKIAVKRLSKASSQGIKEFKNEVKLTAELQHVNLARILGICTEQGEQMLVYEYMPKKSLDLYLFDHNERHLLDWKKRVDIIEGVTQGLLYLQEYSRLTIIHRDLKPSNILLDNGMKPKISDFAMARIFVKDEDEANTSRIVGTIGFIPPEYLNQGVYSTKLDVFSFGVLLLQIISGKKTCLSYGPNKLNILEYAYELRKEGKGMEFMDPILDDTFSPCKLIRCLQIALLCVQENANDRPSMLEVSSMLKNDNVALASPKRPAFASGRDQDNPESSRPMPPLRLDTCSDDAANLRTW